MNRRRKNSWGSRGFSLVELLVVIAILAILGGLLFSISSGILGKGDRERAESELQAISVALESYRLKFGDYPDVESPQQLMAALEGKLGPDGSLLAKGFTPFLESGNYSLSNSDNPELLDPWGVPYHYDYLEPDNLTLQSGYRIFSSGPDRKATNSGYSTEPMDQDNLRYDD